MSETTLVEAPRQESFVKVSRYEPFSLGRMGRVGFIVTEKQQRIVLYPDGLVLVHPTGYLSDGNPRKPAHEGINDDSIAFQAKELVWENLGHGVCVMQLQLQGSPMEFILIAQMSDYYTMHSIRLCAKTDALARVVEHKAAIMEAQESWARAKKEGRVLEGKAKPRAKRAKNAPARGITSIEVGPAFEGIWSDNDAIPRQGA